MKARLVNVVDLEATCWEDRSPPKGQRQEIIEIGLAVVDTVDLEIVSTHSYLVTPTQSEVSEFCTELTTLTQEKLEKEGMTLAEAYDILKDEHDGHNRIMASWGNWDRHMVSIDARNKGIKRPFSSSHLNVKELYSLMRGYSNMKGLGKACRNEGLEFEGTAHRGIDDARMIARIFLRLLGEHR